jgi:hypothetical protein
MIFGCCEKDHETVKPHRTCLLFDFPKFQHIIILPKRKGCQINEKKNVVVE